MKTRAWWFFSVLPWYSQASYVDITVLFPTFPQWRHSTPYPWSCKDSSDKDGSAAQTNLHRYPTGDGVSWNMLSIPTFSVVLGLLWLKLENVHNTCTLLETNIKWWLRWDACFMMTTLLTTEPSAANFFELVHLYTNFTWVIKVYHSWTMFHPSNCVLTEVWRARSLSFLHPIYSM